MVGIEEIVPLCTRTVLEDAVEGSMRNREIICVVNLTDAAARNYLVDIKMHFNTNYLEEEKLGTDDVRAVPSEVTVNTLADVIDVTSRFWPDKQVSTNISLLPWGWPPVD